MSDLIGAIMTGITGREPVNEHSPLADILAELVAAHGSATKAAGALGVKPTTFYRWRNFATDAPNGVRQAPKLGRRTLVAAARRASLSAAHEKRIRTGELTLKTNGLVRVSGDARNRTVDVGNYISHRKMGNVLSSYLAGDDDRADRLLMRHIEENYADLEFDSINWAEFMS